MAGKGEGTVANVDPDSEEDIPIGLMAAKLLSVHATGTKRRHQAVEKQEVPLRSKRIRRLSEKMQLAEDIQEAKARSAKKGRKTESKDEPVTRRVPEKGRTGKTGRKRKGETDAVCAVSVLTTVSLVGNSRCLGLERCRRSQQATASSFDSIVVGAAEKMELDVATSPAKIARQDPGVLVLPCIEEPLPSTSYGGMDCFPPDCKEQTVTLPPATSADISSDLLPGPNDQASSLPSNSSDTTIGLREHPSRLRPSHNGAGPPNPNLGPRLEAGSRAGLATSTAEQPNLPATGVKCGAPRPCSPSLTPRIRSPRTRTPPLHNLTRTPPLTAGTSASKQAAPSVSTPCNAVSRKHMPDGAAFPLNQFQPEELVWARNGMRHEPMWPAKVVEMADVPEAVRRSFVPDTLCVAYFGPASSKKWEKDYAWVKQGNIFPFLDFATWFCGQDLKKRAKEFCTAVTEALLCTSRLDESFDPVPSELSSQPIATALEPTSELTLVRTDSSCGVGAAQLDRSSKLCISKECISCQGVVKKKGKRKEGLEEGHAADLDRVCEACYKLFENKQYCWVCKRIWLPNQTDGWVGCDNSDCGFWIHAECDGIGPERLKAMEDEEAEYHCPRCRAHKETPKVRAPATLAVECDGNEGDYLPGEHLIRCRCAGCLGRKKVEPSVFEQHSRCREGNWRESIRVPRLKSSLSGWLAMMEGFRAEGLAYTSSTVPQEAKAHTAPASVQKRLDVPYTPIQVKWSGERCGVCHSDEDFEDDELITCDRCHVTVHELCYGLRRHPPRGQNDAHSPGENDPGNRNGSLGRRAKVWICRACEDPLLKPHCCLCPVRGGALKPTSVQGRWAHVACAQWVTETQLADPAGAMEPVEGIEQIPKARWDLVCSICKQQCGAPIQCQQPRCVRAYHVMCARLDGLFMEMVARKDGMETRSYCRVHKAVKAENACVSSSLDAELLKRGVVPSRAKPKKAAAVGNAAMGEGPDGDTSAARCRPYVPRSERQQVFVQRRPIPQLYEGAVRHTRPQIDFLQQQCVVHTRIGDELVARRQASAPEGLSVSGLIEHMQATEQSRLSFGRSGIHGCGLIARKKILEGDYVVDYRGTLVRPSVANLREKHYRKIGKDCYLFKVDDQHVVDATETGNLGRLINHSCGPNCYSQITRVDGITRIILRAKRDVQAGEELTYDYRFEQEEDKDRVPCHCGASNCRKFMN